MKLTYTLLFCMIAVIGFSQDHVLPSPKDWPTETINFPIEFAPHIPFIGTEELRFTPGWGDTQSDQLWSYCFLWWVRADSKLDAASLKKYLEEYYGGLVSRNIDRRHIPADKIVPTVAHVVETKNSSKPFTATVDMLDYLSQKPVQLLITVEVTTCDANKRKGFFFSVSPQPYNHPIWKEFNSIWSGFECGN